MPTNRNRSYVVMVAAATAGAGVTSFAVGAAIPQGADTTVLAAKTGKVSAATVEPQDVAAEQERSVAATRQRSSRSQLRAGAPTPVQIPQWARPARGEITTNFEMRWGEFHPGLDIAAPFGTPVRAASDGVVTMAGWNGGFGKMILIDHGGGVTTLYGHNGALRVEVGERVTAGQLIADMGSTGYSTGSHVHFEVHVGERKVDPLAWLRKRGITI